MKALLKKYKVKEIESVYILNIFRRRFFKILKNYREDKNNFSIDYKRVNSNNKIDKDLIECDDNPIINSAYLWFIKVTISNKKERNEDF